MIIEHEQPTDDRPDLANATVIVEALRSKYGNDAFNVAEMQAASSSDESKGTWSVVVDRLRNPT